MVYKKERVTAFKSIAIVKMRIGDSGYFELDEIGPFCDGFVWQSRVLSIGIAQLASIHVCPVEWLPLILFSQVGHGLLDPANALDLP